jgi:hypothetical protein
MNKEANISRQKWTKTILEYTLWTMAALLLGMGYMYVVLGPPPEPTNIWNFFFGKVYFFGLVRVGLAIGSIVAILFILFSVFLINKKWASSKNKFVVQTVALLLIMVFVATLHYLLEKTMDLI